MHGVARPLAVDCEMREVPDALVQKLKLGAGKWIRVKTRFTLKLSDFGIKVPESSIAQVNDQWTVAVEVFGTTEKPAPVETKAPDDDAPDKAYKVKEVKLDAPGARWRFGQKPQHTSICAITRAESGDVYVTGITMSGVAAIDGSKGAVKLSVPVESLSSGVEKIDAAVRAKLGDFIDFESIRAELKDGAWEVEGTVTIAGKAHGVTAKTAVQEITAELAKKQRWGDQPGLKFSATFTLKPGVEGLPGEWSVTIDAVALAER
jgi:polyisoprenoid-binding protein YceI